MIRIIGLHSGKLQRAIGAGHSVDREKKLQLIFKNIRTEHAKLERLGLRPATLIRDPTYASGLPDGSLDIIPADSALGAALLDPDTQELLFATMQTFTADGNWRDVDDLLHTILLSGRARGTAGVDDDLTARMISTEQVPTHCHCHLPATDF